MANDWNQVKTTNKTILIRTSLISVYIYSSLNSFSDGFYKRFTRRKINIECFGKILLTLTCIGDIPAVENNSNIQSWFLALYTRKRFLKVDSCIDVVVLV